MLRIGRRTGALALLPALMVGWLASVLPASARTGNGETVRRDSATATVRGLGLDLFGSFVAIASLDAAIDGSPAARADAAGVALRRGTATSARVDSPDTRQALQACLPELNLFKLLNVRMACAESRSQVLPELFAPDFPRHTGASLDRSTRGDSSRPSIATKGGPQAVGRGSVADADVGDLRPLEPAVGFLRSLLDSLKPVTDQTVGAAASSVPADVARSLRPLAASMGLGSTDRVGRVVTLLTGLLDGTSRATGLVSIKVASSTATTNTDAGAVVALAKTGGGQIDLLPGVAPGGAPLMSIIFGGVAATSRFDRSTAVRTSAFEPGQVRIQFGLPLAGDGVTGMDVRPDTPVTVLAGTPLETTVSLGGGHTVTKADGSVGSVVDGAGLQLLRGVKGGIDLRLGHAESGTGAARAVPGAEASGRWWRVLAAALVVLVLLGLLAHVLRRRRRRSPSSTAVEPPRVEMSPSLAARPRTCP